MIALLIASSLVWAQEDPLPEAETPTDAPAAPVAVAEPEPPKEATLADVLTEHYGPELPHGDLCTAAPALPEVFLPVTAVGQKNNDRGCRVEGIVVAGKWHAPEEAAVAAIRPDLWKAMPSTAKGEALKAWTQLVLVAFDKPDATAVAPTVKATATKGWDVSIGFWQYTDVWHETQKTAAHYVFDATGKLVKVDRSKGEKWHTTFYTQPFELKGQDQAAVLESLEQQGKTLAGCAHDAWLKDPLVKGRTRIGWTITSTKPEKFALADPEMKDLANCYAIQLKKVQFPEGMTGSLIWSFSIDRRLATP